MLIGTVMDFIALYLVIGQPKLNLYILESSFYIIPNRFLFSSALRIVVASWFLNSLRIFTGITYRLRDSHRFWIHQDVPSFAAFGWQCLIVWKLSRSLCPGFKPQPKLNRVQPPVNSTSLLLFDNDIISNVGAQRGQVTFLQDQVSHEASANLYVIDRCLVWQNIFLLCRRSPQMSLWRSYTWN